MPSICAYPARPWACDSPVAKATPHQGLPWILSAALDPGGGATYPLGQPIALLKLSPAQAQNFSVNKARLFSPLTLILSIFRRVELIIIKKERRKKS